jgi:hypothetical protein
MLEPINFVYWLQGFLEIQDPKNINEKQVKIIKDHISLVLHKMPVLKLNSAFDQKYCDDKLSSDTLPTLGHNVQIKYCGEKAAEDIFPNLQMNPNPPEAVSYCGRNASC